MWNNISKKNRRVVKLAIYYQSRVDKNLKDQLKKVCKPLNYYYEYRNSVCHRCPDMNKCIKRK